VTGATVGDARGEGVTVTMLRAAATPTDTGDRFRARRDTSDGGRPLLGDSEKEGGVASR